MIDIDVVVIGGGQAALALGFYLRRTGLSYVILDDQEAPGGAWRHTWDSLRLFSPAQWSSLPGYQLPRGDEYPSRDDVVRYLGDYERRYELPVLRPVHVDAVHRSANRRTLVVSGANDGKHVEWNAGAVVSATGSWANPYVPDLPGADEFRGLQLHSANYRSPCELAGRSVVVVGGGNSGAQIVAELSDVARVEWATLQPPVFLPDDVDGRFLFEQATLRYKALQAGRVPEAPRSLGDIVAVPPVRSARARGGLQARRMFERFTEHGVVWPDDSESRIDVVIWATGFRPALSHLAPLSLVDQRGRVEVVGTRAAAEPRLWLVGYGEWTGYASATLIGVGRSARSTVDEIVKSSGNLPIHAG
jgi:putative flavoprotein involved in K+ transport